MNLLRILRILKKNILLIVIVPILFALIVKQLTKKEVLSYESEMTLFTGLVSGGQLDQSSKGINIYGLNNAFDNLLNLIKSREVATETGMRLLAQHLSLSSPDPTKIFQENYDWVNEFVPQYIKSMRYSHNEINPQEKKVLDRTDNETDTAFLEDDSFVLDGKVLYLPQSGEDLKAIAVKFNVPVSDLLSLNGLETIDLQSGQPIIIRLDENSDNADYIKQSEPKENLVSSNISEHEKFVQRLILYASSDDTNFLSKLLYSKNPFYSITAMSEVSAHRIESSDMVRMRVSGSDPGICQQTLLIMAEVVIRKYKDIKANESDAVVKYFMNEVNRTSKRLQNAEERLLKFNEQNSIINYYEQSRVVAIQKENLDVDYQNEHIRYAASSAVLRKLEEKMGLRQAIQLQTSSILHLRNKLSEITTQISLTESFKDPEVKNQQKLTALKVEADRIKKELTEKVKSLYGNNTAIDGVPLVNIMNAWLENTIIYEQSRASLKILSDRVREFFEYYRTFAPLGATQKRLEREINVAEQEYLSLLNSLNQSKLAQQNVELSADIKTIDPPNYPLKPKPGKSGILIAASAVAGFFLMIFIIVALEFLNSTIRTPERLEELSNLKVIGVYPSTVQGDYSYDMKFITTKLVDLIVQSIEVYSIKTSTSRPKIIALISSMDGEGKSYMGLRVCRQMRKLGLNVLFIQPEKNQKEENISHPSSLYSKFSHKFNSFFFGQKWSEEIEKCEHNVFYNVDNKYYNSTNITELALLGQSQGLSDFNYILLEIPGIVLNPYPTKLLQNCDLLLMVFRANRNWRKSDSQSISTLLHGEIPRPLAILNGTEMDIVEEQLGDLPKHRTWLRRMVKRVVLLKFHEKRKL
ncbi:MAG: hypothetical protein A2X11_02530 [Bacteroidetes bacterium GWE2_42_24]|nr:MAG: hypothetical protein A2X11_02530 [Bacteroidetes bacterium GWE2_42_24]OFY32301.1 MAG: hypothetical protein A2X09_11740 [Bacteroidetes bacterium GWF2_43_11]